MTPRIGDSLKCLISGYEYLVLKFTHNDDGDLVYRTEDDRGIAKTIEARDLPHYIVLRYDPPPPRKKLGRLLDL